MRILANVSSYSALLKELQRVRDKALQGTGEKTKQLVKDRIDEDVYSVATPDVYERTYELRESVQPSKVESKGNVAEVEIGHDTNLIGSYSPNQHYSVVDGSSSVDYIANIVNNGESGKIYGEGYWTKKRPYMDNAQKEMEDGKYREFMEEEINKLGIKTK